MTTPNSKKYKYPSQKIRYTVPIDVTKGLREQLQKEAPLFGLTPGLYVRHLVMTHPDRKRFTKLK